MLMKTEGAGAGADGEALSAPQTFQTPRGPSGEGEELGEGGEGELPPPLMQGHIREETLRS